MNLQIVVVKKITGKNDILNVNEPKSTLRKTFQDGWWSAGGSARCWCESYCIHPLPQNPAYGSGPFQKIKISHLLVELDSLFWTLETAVVKKTSQIVLFHNQQLFSLSIYQTFVFFNNQLIVQCIKCKEKIVKKSPSLLLSHRSSIPDLNGVCCQEMVYVSF